MRRTVIRLTDEQHERIDALARTSGRSKAATIRSLLDAGLDPDDARRAEEALVIWSTAGTCSDSPGWEQHLDDVRSASTADHRLNRLGI